MSPSCDGARDSKNQHFHIKRGGFQIEVAPDVGGSEPAEKVLLPLAHVVGNVYKKKGYLIFIQDGSERRRDFVKTENFFYECDRNPE